MPATAHGLGWDISSDPHLDQFRALRPSDQLVWATRFYSGKKGHLGSVARFYIATFLPAFLDQGDDPNYVLCGLRGPLAAAYVANKGFDKANKGTITVHDLELAAYRAVGPRTMELAVRATAMFVRSVSA
jgi:hypothetical protein